MRFSVIIPTYNRKEALARAVLSVINQTFADWELLIIDDSSTDGTYDYFVNEYFGKDARIHWLDRPSDFPKGANTCRNLGIQTAKGDYIALLDSDDEWLPERLGAVDRFLNETLAKAIYSGARIWNGQQEKIRKSRSIKSDESVFDFVVRHDSFAPTPSLVVERETASNILFDETLQRHQDFDFFIRVSHQADWMYFENWDVRVHWADASKKVLDFKTCLPFYRKHGHLSKDKSVRHEYILWLAEKSAKENPDPAVSAFFRKELKKDGFKFNWRQKILFYSPYFFHRLYKLKRTLG